MQRPVTSLVETTVAIALTAWLTTALLPLLGLASSALLFLLPVLLASVRGGTGPGLYAAIIGAAAYNYFLLEPRFTFRVHQIDNLVSVVVLAAVALVTSRLASRLTAREAEARQRAEQSSELAEVSALLASHADVDALNRVMAMLERRHGKLTLLTNDDMSTSDTAFTSLDHSAAAWAMHNGDVTGHGTEIMPAADWTFLPTTGRSRANERLVAAARPEDGRTRTGDAINQLGQIALLLGQHLDREALDAARRERERLEERDHLRRTFLASLAHDFRTPLTVITGQLAELNQRRPEAADALAAAQRLDRMMTDLVGAARVEAGALEPRLESVDLVDVVSAVCDDYHVADGISLSRDIPMNLPFILADPLLLQHILFNLIDNAARHCRTMIVVSAEQSANRLTLHVSDDGPGVPADERARIFERFSRIEGNDRNAGSGLGLAIVKGFAEAMDMTANVGTSAQGGACFSLSMPVAEGARLS